MVLSIKNAARLRRKIILNYKEFLLKKPLQALLIADSGCFVI